MDYGEWPIDWRWKSWENRVGERFAGCAAWSDGGYMMWGLECGFRVCREDGNGQEEDSLGVVVSWEESVFAETENCGGR